MARELAAAERVYAGGSQARGVGKGAVAASIDHGEMTTAERPNALAEGRVRHLGAKTFVLDGSEWVDTAYDRAECGPILIGWGGERFFKLLGLCDEMPVWLSLGRCMVVMWDGQAYRVSDRLGDGTASLEGHSEAFVSEWFLAWASQSG